MRKGIPLRESFVGLVLIGILGTAIGNRLSQGDPPPPGTTDTIRIVRVDTERVESRLDLPERTLRRAPAAISAAPLEVVSHPPATASIDLSATARLLEDSLRSLPEESFAPDPTWSTLLAGAPVSVVVTTETTGRYLRALKRLSVLGAKIDFEVVERLPAGIDAPTLTYSSVDLRKALALEAAVAGVMRLRLDSHHQAKDFVMFVP